MSMSRDGPALVTLRTVCLLLGTLMCATSFVQYANSQQRSAEDRSNPPLVESSAFVHSAASDDKSTPKSNPAIPPGTILPVRLNSTLSSAKCRKGQVITGRIMQDVPLSPRARIKEGSKVLGHIVEVTPATTGARA